MLKSIQRKNDIEGLKVLFCIFADSNNTKEMLRTAGKIYLKSSDIDKKQLIEITDKVFEVIKNYRQTHRNLVAQLEDMVYNGKFKEVKFIQSHIETFSFSCLNIISKLISNLQEAYSFSKHTKIWENSIFLNMNICDLLRYSCEFAFSESERKRLLSTTKKQYVTLINDIKYYEVHCANPTCLTAYFHYAIFLYDILGDKIQAIKLLKEKHQEIIANLDTVYSKYNESYEVINQLTETLTGWVIESNFGGINNLND